MFILLRVIDKAKINGTNFGLYLVWYGLGRGLIEGLRGDSLYIGNSGIRVSQLISVIILVIGVAMLICNLIRKRKGNGEKV